MYSCDIFVLAWHFITQRNTVAPDTIMVN